MQFPTKKVKECGRVNVLYKYTDKEITDLLKTITILTDSREQRNEHIIDYFKSKSIAYKEGKQDTGDYSVTLPKNEAYGIHRDIYFPLAVERKNSVDELAQTIKERTRFENELIRSKEMKFLLMVEDPNGYENLIMGRYQSQFEPKALLGSLKSFEARYGFSTVFIPKKAAGNYLYHHFYYHVRNFLKGM